MNYKEFPKYLFALTLVGVAAYGFFNSIEFWQMWLVAAIGYLTGSKIWNTVMD